MSANTTGPAELRRNTVLNPFSDDELRDLAAAWDADRAALESETERADAAELAHETDCGQLREEINHLRASGSLLANQMRCGICGGNLTVLLACPVCGIRYELVNQDVQARHMSKLRVYEQASKLAPPFAAQSFEAVQVALEQRDAASAALERARALPDYWREQAKTFINPLSAQAVNICADELSAALAPDGAR